MSTIRGGTDDAYEEGGDAWMGSSIAEWGGHFLHIAWRGEYPDILQRVAAKLAWTFSKR